MYYRIYTGDDGQSHFEVMSLPFTIDGKPVLQAAKTISFHVQPPGTFVDFHTVPEKAYFITLAGQGEVSNGLGEKHLLNAGDMTLCEDFTGQGHAMRIVSTTPRVFARIILDQGSKNE